MGRCLPPSCQMPPMLDTHTPSLQVSHVSWQVPSWKFEKLQIMLLGFRYLESSEKSEKIHKYYTYRAIITEIYKAWWQVLMEIQAIQISNWGLISRQETSLNSGRCDGGCGWWGKISNFQIFMCISTETIIYLIGKFFQILIVSKYEFIWWKKFVFF